MFLINSRRRFVRCAQLDCSNWESLFRSYGRYFAEFLEEQSLVHLGLLDLTTCVGLRYGFMYMILEAFLERVFLFLWFVSSPSCRYSRYICPDFPRQISHKDKVNPVILKKYNPLSLHRNT